MSNRPLKIFFSGIGGSGVSSIASFMADRGHTVIGSDRSFDSNPAHPLYTLLKSKGILIVPQDGSALDRSFDFTVFSTAVEHDMPEFIKATSLGIPIKTRPRFLAELASEFATIAVAGTSGKSTSSGMLAFLMQRLGLSPNFIGGGRVKQFKTKDHPGNSLAGDSDILIMEACESDGTITGYKPEHVILLNLHLDHHAIEVTAELFKTLIDNTKGMVVINADDKKLRKTTTKEVITFSIDYPSKYKATDIIYKPWNTDFSLHDIHFTLSLPGKYNLYNALSCIAMLSEMGIPIKDIASILYEFEGIERRFDVHLNDGKWLVIDDYAHNPHKLSSLIQTMKNIRKGVCYIFQPHGFGPTRMMKEEYIEVFSQNLDDSDHLILLPIFYAGGTAIKDISSQDLADGIRSKGKSVEVIEKREAILMISYKWDTYVICGARDETLSDFARVIAENLTSTHSSYSTSPQLLPLPSSPSHPLGK
jgi:UDP-N-acetylmuramate--alanine ligase